MTYEQSDGEHTPARSASSEPTGPIPDAPPVGPGATDAHMAPAPPHAHPGPGPAGPAPQPTRLARFGARWRTSLALRVTTAVVVALLISGVGFAAGAAFGGGDDPHHPHRVTADHPFWQDHMGWFHRNTDADAVTTPHHRHTTPTALPAAPVPDDAHTR